MKFLKDFSKEHYQQERDSLAREIREKRNENRQRESEKIERDVDLEKRLEEIVHLKDRIADFSENGLSKIMNYFKIKNLRSELGKKESSYDQAEAKEILPPDLEEPRRMVDAFYSSQEKKWAKSEYSKEDIDKYFSEEHLASLSLEEYVLLMKRFPSEMVTHVTRQGIRDHTGHIFHNSGQGAFHNGFKNMIRDGKLRSPMGVHMVEVVKRETMEKYLELDRFEDENQALEYFLNKLNPRKQEDAGGYADAMAIHFAAEEVPDEYYGSERNNEIFIAYPSALVASKYKFFGQLNKSGGGYWNDQWVWANEGEGVDLNAGIFFIPERAQVNKETGSRYEIDERGNPIVNNDLIAQISEIYQKSDFQAFSAKAIEILGGRYSEKDRDELEKEFEDKFGVSDVKVKEAMVDYGFLFHNKYGKFDEEVKKVLQGKGIYFKEAQNAISSKEYWEKYFSENPQQKPSKIVYYEGSPSNAMYDWKKSNGLVKKSESSEILFPENRVSKDSEEATLGIDRFRDLAVEVINDYYGAKEKSAA